MKQIEKKLDKICSEITRKKGYCEFAGKDEIRCGGPLDTMHYIGRRSKLLRWNLDNLSCGCRNHHTFYTVHPNRWQERFSKMFPGKHLTLEDKKNQIVKWTDADLEEMYNDLQDESEQLDL